MYFEPVGEVDSQLAISLQKMEAYVSKTLKRGILPKQSFESSKLIIQKEMEVRGSMFNFLLVHP